MLKNEKIPRAVVVSRMPIEEPHERLSELPVIPREKSDTGAAAGENPRDAPVIAR